MAVLLACMVCLHPSLYIAPMLRRSPRQPAWTTPLTAATVLNFTEHPILCWHQAALSNLIKTPVLPPRHLPPPLVVRNTILLPHARARASPSWQVASHITVELVRSVPLFNELPAYIQEQVAGRLVPFELEPGDELCTEGDEADRLWFIQVEEQPRDEQGGGACRDTDA